MHKIKIITTLSEHCFFTLRLYDNIEKHTKYN